MGHCLRNNNAKKKRRHHFKRGLSALKGAFGVMCLHLLFVQNAGVRLGLSLMPTLFDGPSLLLVGQLRMDLLSLSVGHVCFRKS